MGDSQWCLQKQEIPLRTQTHEGDQISEMKTKDISGLAVQHIEFLCRTIMLYSDELHSLSYY